METTQVGVSSAMSSLKLSESELSEFHHEGFFVVPNLFDTEEVTLLEQIARADRELASETRGRRDGVGGTVQLAIRNELSEDIYAAIVRSSRIVERMEQLLGGEVYHYHHKMIFKEPLVGGAWAWHQDYGYWYDNGCLFPDMASCMIAVDRATRANGCLQVLRGSHRMGRINHGKVGRQQNKTDYNLDKVGDQTGADPERVQAALERLELVHCELEPGSAIFFHCNLLHRSDQNKSPDPRWGFICCYNMARNDPYKESQHPRYSPLERWPDARVKEIGRAQHAVLLGETGEMPGA